MRMMPLVWTFAGALWDRREPEGLAGMPLEAPTHEGLPVIATGRIQACAFRIYKGGENVDTYFTSKQNRGAGRASVRATGSPC